MTTVKKQQKYHFWFPKEPFSAQKVLKKNKGSKAGFQKPVWVPQQTFQ